MEVILKQYTKLTLQLCNYSEKLGFRCGAVKIGVVSGGIGPFWVGFACSI